jgi:hypothetical protein
MGGQVLCQNRRIGIRNYFNIFGAGGGIKIFQNPVEFIQQMTINKKILRLVPLFMVNSRSYLAFYR